MNNQALEERLARLEKKNRLQTFALYAVAACFCLYMFTGKTEAAQTTLQATRFELVNASGELLGVWEGEKDRTTFVMARPDGGKAVKLFASANVSGVTLLDNNEETRAAALVDNGLPSFALFEKDLAMAGTFGMTSTGPKLDLRDAAGNLRTRMGVAGEHSFVQLLDQSQKEVWGQKAP